MNKTMKKFLAVVIVLAAICLIGATNSFAATELQQKYFGQFQNKKFQSQYNLYLGEKFEILDWSMGYPLKDYTKITSNNSKVVEVLQQKYGTDRLIAKSVGKAEITIQITLDEKTETKKFNINVISTNENTKLESKVDDIVTISGDVDSKTKILLANSQLWSTKSNTFKLDKKETTNVAKFVYAHVYQGVQYYSGESISSTLKKDNTLIAKNENITKTIKNVIEISKYGYLDSKGNFYIYKYINDNGKFDTVKKATGVKKLIGDYLLVKKNATYNISGDKIFDFEIEDADKSSYNTYGLVLNTKGEVYNYAYNWTEKKFLITKVATKVKKLNGNYKYTTNAGKVEQYKPHESYNSNDYKESIYLQGSNTLAIKNKDNCLYLNDVKILSNVDYIYTTNGTKNTSALIVRKDGSIWKLDVYGKSKLTKVRSGKIEEKRIDAPKDVKVTKVGDNNAKITWSKVEEANKYTVYRATSKNGKYKKIATTENKSFIDETIKTGKEYFYKVVANSDNSTFDSAQSKYGKIKIPKTTKVTAKKKSNTSINVTYKKVSGVSGYEIEYSTSKNFKNATVKDTKKLSATIKKLTKNKTYYIRVRAYNKINGQKVYGAYSSVQIVKLK